MTSKYVHIENVRRYERMLLTEIDPKKRALLSRLLMEERTNEAKTPKSPLSHSD